ncbi:DUF4304 domain-containing protein [Hymenobacter sp. BRD67]|uniref:DUF4304 domain-containing protein n=1 Tax=Hymenobacter sp. BRD67 TaxID=2675877 RepID=UPI00156686C4|nr:DUF4304 domain-containing protein [Hymenobacter sp. BRD67]QKG51812.1 DUF4304 domain-containing protein [Hymenobacter sp. BRD67]
MWPEFKARGYRKTGNNFRLYNSDGWGKIVNIQKSSFSDKDAISFTINTGLYLVKADTMFEVAREERFLEPDCLVRKRIGNLNGLQKDLWYELTQATPLEEVGQEVKKDFLSFILPYLDSIESEEDICHQIIRERRPKSVEAIRALFDCGYQDESRQWVEEELSTTIYRAWRQQLTVFKNSLA